MAQRRKRKPTPITIVKREVIGWIHVCPECGTEFKSRLERAVTCSDRCRQARNRAGRSQ